MGDNVTISANVILAEPIHIGSDVIIGGGSVVVKDVFDNVCCW
ncbi:hypothetical protein [Bacteroides thetaiotaomicron]